MIYEGKAELDEKELRKALSTELPHYMIPAKYIAVEEMPRNANGKIDRLLLKEKYIL